MLQRENAGQLMGAARETIQQQVLRWEGVTARAHRFGGIEFRLGKREPGHLHGDVLMDIPFPMSVRNEIVASGMAEEHHVLPRSGWVSLSIRTEADIEHAVALLRRSFDLARITREEKVDR